MLLNSGLQQVLQDLLVLPALDTKSEDEPSLQTGAFVIQEWSVIGEPVDNAV